MFGVLQVQKFCTMVLSALMKGIDDKEDVDDVIKLEAMGGLSRILSCVSENDIQAILINIALSIRPCFEKVTFLLKCLIFFLHTIICLFMHKPLLQWNA